MNEHGLIWQIKQEFEAALEAKTGWGKEELKRLYDNIVIKVLSEIVSKSNKS